MNHIKLIPLYLTLFVWQLRCFYMLDVVNPLWWMFELPIDSEDRTLRILGIELLIVANILFQLACRKEKLTDWYVGSWILFLFGICLVGMSF